MQFEQAVVNAMRQLVASEAIEKAIAERLHKTVLDCLNSELGHYSDFGKALQEQVKKALAVTDDVDLPSYNDLILRVVREKTLGLAEATIQKQVAEQLERLLTPAPETITLSDLVAKFIDYVKARRQYDCTCHDEERITLHVYQAHDVQWQHVQMDEQPDRPIHGCGIDLGVHLDDAAGKSGTVYSLNLRRSNVDVDRALFCGPYYGVEKFLFDLKVNRSRLVFDRDAEEIETSYSLHD